LLCDGIQDKKEKRKARKIDNIYGAMEEMKGKQKRHFHSPTHGCP
jgi:hypothetical protein